MNPIEIYQVGEVLDTTTSAEQQQNINVLLEISNHIALDLSRCTYVSSAGLRVMLYSYKVAKSKGGKVVLLGVSDEIREVMSMTGFDKFFPFYPTIEEYPNE